MELWRRRCSIGCWTGGCSWLGGVVVRLWCAWGGRGWGVLGVGFGVRGGVRRGLGGGVGAAVGFFVGVWAVGGWRLCAAACW